MFRFLKPENEVVKSDDKDDDEPMREVKEILINSMEHNELADRTSCNEFSLEGALEKPIRFLSVSDLGTNIALQESCIKKFISSSTDLISGEYEGGFKIWECSFDLIRYAHKCLDFTAKVVLDLGCGSGLLGVYALLCGATRVDFQDYNWEVLHYLTIPNTIINVGESTAKGQCSFYAGDWKHFNQIKEESPESSDSSHNQKYDVILTSETIYNLKYLPRLCWLLKRCLKPDGYAIVAAKTVYFGVGGGTHAFLNTAAQLDLVAEVVETIRAGVQRDIILVKLKTGS